MVSLQLRIRHTQNKNLRLDKHRDHPWNKLSNLSNVLHEWNLTTMDRIVPHPWFPNNPGHDRNPI